MNFPNIVANCVGNYSNYVPTKYLFCAADVSQIHTGNREKTCVVRYVSFVQGYKQNTAPNQVTQQTVKRQSVGKHRTIGEKFMHDANINHIRLFRLCTKKQPLRPFAGGRPCNEYINLYIGWLG